MIKLIVLDVDGTMTDGKITYSNSNEEYKSFNVKDGLAIVSYRKLGGKVAIITGRESKIVENRAKELGVDFIYQKIKNKREKVEEILDACKISWDEVAVIGDDLNDLPMIKPAKHSFAPIDANSYIIKKVDTVLSSKGGEGAVREMIENILEQEGKIEEFIRLWEVD